MCRIVTWVRLHVISTASWMPIESSCRVEVSVAWGRLGTMRSSLYRIAGRSRVSIVLVYMLIVVNFQSWLDPSFIITALPAALAGIVLFLFITQTTLASQH